MSEKEARPRNPPEGAKILEALKRASVRFVVAVPDAVTSEGLLWPICRDPYFRLVRVCKEDEGISICAAMSYCDTKAILLMQQTGLMDSLNALRAIGMDYCLPVCMLVGLQGKEDYLTPRESKSYGVRIIEPILDAMEVRYDLIESSGDENLVCDRIAAAYRESVPQCFLIGRPPLPP
ncbi:MAG: decarboxylase [Albidovulum sp.]|nr:decarboxylase [Albidovulum sp.]MDE0306103.1 decarboxylase [Albidovulum sp.]MDE0531811.1 decarboxylase [Albidovulum sp.]